MRGFVTAIVEEEGEPVKEVLHGFCSRICSDEQNFIKKFKSDSQYLLWQQQEKQLIFKNGKSMK